ncbi:MAG: MAE_28990/MAE_18760 family HEPN-like nuclease, partial [bacterium]
TELLDSLDEEFAWRRKELTMLWNDVKSAVPKHRTSRLRASVAILYAHWEGFVKAASESYIAYVAAKRFKYSELSDSFLALALRSKLNKLTGNNDALGYIDFIKFLNNELLSRARIPEHGVIKTGANLSSKRLKSIVLTLGLDYSPFELKENLIDTQLLYWRNSITHGKYCCPKEKDFDRLYEETTTLLRNFKEQLENAIVLNSFRKKNSS